MTVPLQGVADDRTDQNFRQLAQLFPLQAQNIAGTPVDVTGVRDDPEDALANLLTALASLGLITDSTDPT